MKSTILELIDALGVKVETLSDTPFEKMLEIVQVFKYLSKRNSLSSSMRPPIYQRMS